MKKHIIFLTSFFALISLLAMPVFVRAQEERDPGTQEDLLSITERAEAGVANALPQEVKDFFSKTFSSIETFRLGQVTTATAKRDELKIKLDEVRAARDQATEDNRDQVIKGESTNLFSGAGDRLSGGAPIGLVVQYYAYKFYTAFVSSPILFYLLGSFIIVYIIGTLFNRARRRGE